MWRTTLEDAGPVLAHTFERVALDTAECDARLAVQGMHRVTGLVRRRVRQPTPEHRLWYRGLR
jgi:hypothetical protein